MTTEKTLAEIIAETDAEVTDLSAQLRGDLEASLPDVRDLRDAKNATERVLKEKEEPIRRWLQLNQDTEGPLYSEKGNLTARLIERHGADTYDTDRMQEDLVLLLHKIGALKIDGAVIKASKSEEIRERIKAFTRPGPVAYVLEVRDKQ